MSRLAWLYVLSTIAVGAVIAVTAFLAPRLEWADGLTAILLLVIATVGQMIGVRHKIRAKGDKGATWYSSHLIFLFAGVLTLPTSYFVFLVFFTHLFEWIYERRIKNSAFLADWYIQPFNVSVHILSGFIAHGFFEFITQREGLAFDSTSLLVGAVSVIVYLACNHLLVGEALVLARGLTWKQTGVLSRENLMADVVLLGFGYSTGLLMSQNPLLVIPSAALSLFIQRAMMIPSLKEEARLDPKTGLMNAREFDKQLKAEFNRARRFNRPMAIIFADLDMFREVNNRYGHLAGDDVLHGVADVLSSYNRKDYDLVGRFGGEEFVVAMPETMTGEALIIAERIRMALESKGIPARGVDELIYVTVSLGVAQYPRDANTLEDLIQAADSAVYRAKALGRNRVVNASDLPQLPPAEVKPAMPAPQQP